MTQFDISLLQNSKAPEVLLQSNQSLLACFQEENIDIDKIALLSRERAILVEKLLSQITGDNVDTQEIDDALQSMSKASIKAFIQQELSINQRLLAYIDSVKDEVKQEILGLTKGKKAIGHYTGKHAKLHKAAST